MVTPEAASANLFRPETPGAAAPATPTMAVRRSSPYDAQASWRKAAAPMEEEEEEED